MRSPFSWGTAVILLAALVYFISWGRGAADGPDPHRDEVVYVCTESGRVVRGGPLPVPAVNPHTGRATLMPGLYCPQCGAWHPSAPFDLVQRDPNARLCPKHRTPMQPRE